MTCHKRTYVILERVPFERELILLDLVVLHEQCYSVSDAVEVNFTILVLSRGEFFDRARTPID